MSSLDSQESMESTSSRSVSILEQLRQYVDEKLKRTLSLHHRLLSVIFSRVPQNEDTRKTSQIESLGKSHLSILENVQVHYCHHTIQSHKAQCRRANHSLDTL